MAVRRLTSADIVCANLKKILQLIAEGGTLQTIAERYKLTTSTLSRVLSKNSKSISNLKKQQRLDLILNNHELIVKDLLSGRTRAQLAAEYGWSPITFCYYLRLAGIQVRATHKHHRQ